MVDPLEMQARRALLVADIEAREHEITQLKARIAEIDYWLRPPSETVNLAIGKAVVTARSPRKIAKEKNHEH